jgi:hypothetical protein
VISRGVAARLQRSFGAFVGWHAGYGFGLASYSAPHARATSSGTTWTSGSTTPGRLVLAPHDVCGRDGIDAARRAHAGTADASVVTSSLERQVTRTWAARVEYSRPIQYVAGLTQPLLSDAVRVGLEGRLTATSW